MATHQLPSLSEHYVDFWHYNFKTQIFPSRFLSLGKEELETKVSYHMFEILTRTISELVILVVDIKIKERSLSLHYESFEICFWPIISSPKNVCRASYL